MNDTCLIEVRPGEYVTNPDCACAGCTSEMGRFMRQYYNTTTGGLAMNDEDDVLIMPSILNRTDDGKPRATQRDCPACSGSGRTGNVLDGFSSCPTCRGSGLITGGRDTPATDKPMWRDRMLATRNTLEDDEDDILLLPSMPIDPQRAPTRNTPQRTIRHTANRATNQELVDQELLDFELNADPL